jgi:hypothetical protein
MAGFPPDRSHFGTLLLIDLISAHSDDWFTFPLSVPPGTIVTLQEVEIHDSLGQSWKLKAPQSGAVFSVKGLGSDSLLVWPSTGPSLAGPPVDEALLGIDEDANLLWGVERRYNGREVVQELGAGDLPTASTAHAAQPIKAGSPKSYLYQPTKKAYPHWFPYEIKEEKEKGRRLFVQKRLADLTTRPPETPADPQTRLFKVTGKNDNEEPHRINPVVIPSTGLGLGTRYRLAREVDGRPSLWLQRYVFPLFSPPQLRLEFDLLLEEASTNEET